MRIAVDFDGTIVENRFPSIGEERPFAIETLKKLRAENHRLILWTVRHGEYLEEALRWCEERGLTFDAVNQSYLLDDHLGGNVSHKANAELFIDDRNLGGIPDWTTIYQMIHSGHAFEHPAPEKVREKICYTKNIFIRFGEWIEEIKEEVNRRKK
ncbi:MAG: hypothetical protein MJZ30_07125 [Paludibacteraceae bacterium]|nr:hypothetical protein [Paludibacteraceae bacterium]